MFHLVLNFDYTYKTNKYQLPQICNFSFIFTNVIVDILWTRSNFVKLLNMFHIVLIFYYTCKTNTYRLLLLEIIGVTSTKLTI